LEQWFLKLSLSGVHVVDEINLTTKYWKFDYYIHKNNLEKGSNIFEAKNIIKSIT
jgi:hypothetical protein